MKIDLKILKGFWNNVKIRYLFKVTLSLILLIIVFRKVDLGHFKELLTNVNLFYLLMAVIIIYVGIIISSLKWKIILSGSKINVSMKESLRAYYSGMFFNLFLPSTIGGDFVRSKLIIKKDKDLSKSLISVFFDRYLGVVALSFLAIIGGVICAISNYPVEIVLPAILFSAAIIMTAFIFFKTKISFKMKSKFLRNIIKNKLRRLILKCHDHLNTYRKLSNVVIKGLFLSLLFQSIVVLYFFMIVKSLNIYVPIGYAFLIVPLISIFTMIPISLNGIGLREAAYTFFFSYIGLSSASAVASSFLSFSIMLCINMIGGIFFVIARKENNENKIKNTENS